MSKKSKKNIDNHEIIYPEIEEINKLDFKEYCPYLNDYEKKVHAYEAKRKAEFCDQLIYIPKKESFVYRLGTYNVHNFVNICPDTIPHRNLNNTLDLINNVDLDLICLQEVYPTDPRGNIIENTLTEYDDLKNLNFDYLKNKMKSIGFTDYYIVNSMLGKNPNNASNCYYPLANAFFSKTPLINKTSYHLDGNRSLLFAETNIGSVKVLIVGTHLEYSNYNHKTDELPDDLIKHQALKVIEYIEKEEKDRNISNIFLMGDLNNESNHPSLEPIFKRFKNKSKSKKGGSSFYRRETKDYILTDSSEIYPSYVHNVKSGHSDHLLLFNDFIYVDADKDVISLLTCKYMYLTLNQDSYENEAKLQKEFYPNEKYLKIKVSDETIKNSHFELDQWYATDNIQLLCETKPFQYHKAIKVLYDTYGGSYLKNLYRYSHSLAGYRLNSRNLSPEKTMDMETILFHYIKTRPNMKTIILWPTSDWYKKNEILRELLDFLNLNGIVYYQKKIDLSYYQASNLIFHLYMTTSRNKDMNSINFNTKMKGWSSSTSTVRYPVLVIFYEYSGPQNNITGSDAYFKTELRSFFTKSATKELRNYDILHINDFYSETLDNSGLFLNPNSLEVLKNANIVKLTRNASDFNVYALNSYKKILQNNFNLLEMERFILMSSFVIFTYGTRPFADLDGTVLYDPVPDNAFLKKYNMWFDITGKKYQPYIDLTMEGTIRYKDYIGVFKNKIAKILGVRGMRELILNPKYHYYFFGIKTIILPFELIQKVFRFRPKSLVDIIKVGEIIKKKFKIPKIPNVIDDPFYYKEHMTKKLVLNTMTLYFRQFYNEKITPQDILAQYVSNKPITINTHLDNTLIDRYLFFHCFGYASTHPFLKDLPFEHQITKRTHSKRSKNTNNTNKTKTGKTKTNKTKTNKTKTNKTKTGKTKTGKTKTNKIKTGKNNENEVNKN
jgi:endonuclease/exonuclease/phosphatase family metal-dependent hydrolase